MIDSHDRPTVPVPAGCPDEYRSWLLSAAWGGTLEARQALAVLDGRQRELAPSSRRWLKAVMCERRQGRPTMRAGWAREVLEVLEVL